MRYHAPTGQFTVSPQDLEYAATSLIAVLRHIRTFSARPLTKYRLDGPLEEPEFAQQRVIDIANSMGIDLGSEWAYEIDVQDDE